MSTSRDNYLTVREAGQLLRRTPWSIYEAIQRGELRAFQPGGEGALLIRPGDLRAYVETWDTATSQARQDVRA